MSILVLAGAASIWSTCLAFRTVSIVRLPLRRRPAPICPVSSLDAEVRFVLVQAPYLMPPPPYMMHPGMVGPPGGIAALPAGAMGHPNGPQYPPRVHPGHPGMELPPGVFHRRSSV